jgi:alpha-tubulin suppressor-like RCC1 family protein
MRSLVSRLLLASLAVAASTFVGLSSPTYAASGWTSVTSGDDHTCGIRVGRIYCWGDDTYGQLGDGAAGGSRATPAPIASAATDWTSVSAGNYHTCAVRAGRVACWGRDNNGQLGDGTVNDTSEATPGLIASGATDWKSVTAGA